MGAVRVNVTVATFTGDGNSAVVELSGANSIFGPDKYLDCSQAYLAVYGGTGGTISFDASPDDQTNIVSIADGSTINFGALTRGVYPMPFSPAKVRCTMVSHSTGTLNVRIVNAFLVDVEDRFMN